ncbi:MAG: hypothetical protein NZM26_01425 [Patescibacteria group bacterium]|nr:hypothetical protein [Patescibacteria group bacterium]
MKKTVKVETKIILFYVLFFTWLYVITFLTNKDFYLNLFTSLVTAVYFTILRQRGDIEVFILSMIIPVLITMFPISNMRISFQPELVLYLPVWHLLAWGIVIVSLKRFADFFVPRYP